jgi:hypothetical protein
MLTQAIHNDTHYFTAKAAEIEAKRKAAEKKRT